VTTTTTTTTLLVPRLPLLVFVFPLHLCVKLILREHATYENVLIAQFAQRKLPEYLLCRVPVLREFTCMLPQHLKLFCREYSTLRLLQ